MSKENWKPIRGYKGYEVSDQGRVRSLPRTITALDGRKMKYKGKVLKASLSTSGYPVVNLKGSPTPIHRLVAEAFIKRVRGLPVVLHKDRDKTRNRVANLKWGNRSDAQSLSFEGTDRISGYAKLTPAQVKKVYVAKGTVVAIGERFGVSHATVVSIKNGRTWSRFTGHPKKV